MGAATFVCGVAETSPARAVAVAAAISIFILVFMKDPSCMFMFMADQRTQRLRDAEFRSVVRYICNVNMQRAAVLNGRRSSLHELRRAFRQGTDGPRRVHAHRIPVLTMRKHRGRARVCNERRTPGSARGIRNLWGFAPWGRRMPTL